MSRVNAKKGANASTRSKTTPALAMSQWIGRLADDPTVWFLVWAPTRLVASRMIKHEIGAIARGSLKQIQGPGYFLFLATVKKTARVPVAELQPATGECLILYDPASEAWILNKLETTQHCVAGSDGSVAPRPCVIAQPHVP